MKTLTNYAAGPRGINLDNGTTRWVEPGQSIELAGEGTESAPHSIDVEGATLTVVGKLPDFGKSGDTPGQADRIAVLEAENATLRARLAELEGSEPGPLDGSVDDLTAHLVTVDDADEVQILIDAETAGKSRKGALAALEARRDELLAK